MKERKDRVDDALNATRAAVEEGIVPGGGVALLRAKKALDAVTSKNPDVQAGINIVSKALEAPIRQIVENAGVEGSIVVGKLLEKSGNFGFDAQNEEYCDMVAAGIIDPTKVVRVALQDAASVASILITTEAMIAEKPKDKSGGGMPGGMGGGGMGGMGGDGLLSPNTPLRTAKPRWKHRGFSLTRAALTPKFFGNHWVIGCGGDLAPAKPAVCCSPHGRLCPCGAAGCRTDRFLRHFPTRTAAGGPGRG